MENIKTIIRQDAELFLKETPYAHVSKQFKEGFDSAVNFVLNHEKFDIDEIWESLDHIDKELLAADLLDDNEQGKYETVEDAFEDLISDSQLDFLIYELKKFHPWEVARMIKQHKIKDWFNEINSDM